MTEHRIITRTCPCCATATAGSAPEGVAARAQYGPRVLATAAELTCAHYLPVGRATALLATLTGAGVSVGFMAGVRGRAARLLEQHFLPRVRQLLRSVGVLHADETVRHEAPVRREALGVEGGGRPSRRVVAAARSKRSAA